MGVESTEGACKFCGEKRLVEVPERSLAEVRFVDGYELVPMACQACGMEQERRKLRSRGR